MSETVWYIVTEPFKTLCCSRVFEIGEELYIVNQRTPNRLMVADKDGMHRVKRSTFMRCTKVKEGDS